MPKESSNTLYECH
jgi:hypothetical protein